MAGLADTFPESLPAFQRMFPDDEACALYLESIRWRDGFECPRCKSTATPMRLGRPESPTYAELYDGDWEHPGTTGVS